MAKAKFTFDKKFIFWIIICVVGLASLLAGAILIGITHNSLLWLPTAFGIALFVIGLTFMVYLIVIEHKRKVVRSRGI